VIRRCQAQALKSGGSGDKNIIFIRIVARVLEGLRAQVTIIPMAGLRDIVVVVVGGEARYPGFRAEGATGSR